MRESRRSAGYDFSVALSRVLSIAQTSHRSRAFWPTHIGRRVCEVVSFTKILRQRRLAWHVETRWRRGPDEPSYSQCRSVDVVDGKSYRNSRVHGDAST